MQRRTLLGAAMMAPLLSFPLLSQVSNRPVVEAWFEVLVASRIRSVDGDEIPISVHPPNDSSPHWSIGIGVGAWPDHFYLRLATRDLPQDLDAIELCLPDNSIITVGALVAGGSDGVKSILRAHS